jgi:hypothetical protein
MDPITISALTATAWTLIQPHLRTIATKSAEKISELVPETIGKLWGKVVDRFNTKPASQEVTSDLLKNPDDSDLQASFRVQLKKAMEEDPGFAEQIKELVEKADAQTNVQVVDGAAAVGDRAKAVGKGGILVEGNVSGDVIGAGATKKAEKKK